MKAVICTKYGKPEVLKLGEWKKPQPKHGEILVKVSHTAVTATDTILRRLDIPGGHIYPIKALLRFAMRLFIGFRKPRNPILGLVFSGEVEGLGDKVQDFQIGDKVFGLTGLSRGSYAEYKCILQKEINLGEVFLSPQNANHEQSVAIVYGGVLALHFLGKTQIKSGQKVLVYGASGAIGTMAIQILKTHDVEVTAICSSENFDMVTELGADKVFSYKDDNSINWLDQYDLVLDAVGKNKTSPFKKELKKNSTSLWKIYFSRRWIVKNAAPLFTKT